MRAGDITALRTQTGAEGNAVAERNQGRFTGLLINIRIDVSTTLPGQELTGHQRSTGPDVIRAMPAWLPESREGGHLRRIKKKIAMSFPSVLYLLFAFCAAQRLRCASAIRLRASGLNTRDFRDFAGDFLVLRSVAFEEPEPASRERTWVSRAISESIWARIDSIAIALSITQSTRICIVGSMIASTYPK